MSRLALSCFAITALLLTFYCLIHNEAFSKNDDSSALDHTTILQRQRRSSPTRGDSWSADGDNKILSPSNIARIKEFVREDIDELVEKLVNDKLRQHLTTMKNNFNCVCPGMRGERGPRGAKGDPGPPGPPGPQGERGLGLHPPRLSHKYLNLTAVAGKSIIFSCIFFGNPLPAINWTHVPSRANIQTKVDRQRSEIETFVRLDNVTWSDHGEISCHASNLFGNASGSGLLTVLTAPIISLPRRPLIGILGMTMNFPECRVVSVPEFNVTWERGFLPFPAGRTYKINGTLRIRHLSVEDEGYYKCEASNYLGTTTSIMHLRVKPLQFLRRPKFYEYVSNGSKVLYCSALGPRNRLSGRWYNVRNERLLPEIRTIQKGEEFIVSTVIRESGRYRCEISNGITKVESYVEVAVLHLNSSILDSRNVDTVGSWLKDVSSIGRYKLCWSSSADNFKQEEFYNKCAWKPNTLSIFKTDSGPILGGFTDSMWRNTKGTPDKKITNCGAEIKGSTVIDYSQHAPSSCSWYITTNNPVMLAFESFSIPCKCSTYLILESDGKGIGRYCGSNKPTGAFSMQGSVSIKTESSCYGDRNYFYRKFKVIVKEIEYGYSSKSFLFSFSSSPPLKIPVQQNEKAICHLHKYEPCFGEKELVYHKGSVKVDIGRAYKIEKNDKIVQNSSRDLSYKSYLSLIRNRSLNVFNHDFEDWVY